MSKPSDEILKLIEKGREGREFLGDAIAVLALKLDEQAERLERLENKFISHDMEAKGFTPKSLTLEEIEMVLDKALDEYSQIGESKPSTRNYLKQAFREKLGG